MIGVHRYINITAAGTYTFTTDSDDGSALYVGNQNTPIVNNIGSHGATVKTGTYTFAAPGIYPIAIGYYQSPAARDCWWR